MTTRRAFLGLSAALPLLARPRPSTRHPEIRRAAARYDRARKALHTLRPEYDRLVDAAPQSAVMAFEDGPLDAAGRDADSAWSGLGEALAAAGYAALIMGGVFYLASKLIPETGDMDDDHGSERFRSALILDLDAPAIGGAH